MRQRSRNETEFARDRCSRWGTNPQFLQLSVAKRGFRVITAVEAFDSVCIDQQALTPQRRVNAS